MRQRSTMVVRCFPTYLYSRQRLWVRVPSLVRRFGVLFCCRKLNNISSSNFKQILLKSWVYCLLYQTKAWRIPTILSRSCQWLTFDGGKPWCTNKLWTATTTTSLTLVAVYPSSCLAFLEFSNRLSWGGSIPFVGCPRLLLQVHHRKKLLKGSSVSKGG